MASSPNICACSITSLVPIRLCGACAISPPSLIGVRSMLALRLPLATRTGRNDAYKYIALAALSKLSQEAMPHASRCSRLQAEHFQISLTASCLSLAICTMTLNSNWIWPPLRAWLHAVASSEQCVITRVHQHESRLARCSEQALPA